MNLNLLLIWELVLMPLSLVCYNRLQLLKEIQFCSFYSTMHLKICFQLMPIQCQMKLIVH